MDKNKESLKVKLMLRRPINQLVAQGILPPLKTPPAFHEQRQKLERAKMGDLLKAKIQQRPDRQELVRQHILEDVGHVDPSLAERQRMLKKCKLADSLNDQLSHRPGPLELIKKNILHTEEPIERAVKEGHIEFKATCEGHKTKPQHPDHYMTLDDDSQSSEAASPPRELLGSPPREHELRPYSRDMLETAAAQAGIVTVVVTPGTLLTAAPSPSLSLSSLSPLSSISSPPHPQHSPRTPVQQASCPAPGKDKNRKKSKTKTQLKTRTIKFHEYKGPPNAHKSSAANAANPETSYELLLQQQQLFLQWQLEWQHKYPQIILPASQKSPDQTQSLITVTTASPVASTTTVQPSPPPPPTDTRPLRNLDDMKVCTASPAQTTEPESPSPSTPAPSTPSSPASITSFSMETTEQSEEIIREQKRRIEQLQRQLLQSQLQLQKQSTFQTQQMPNAKASLAAFLQQQQLNQLLQQQQQQQQQQQLQQQAQLIGIISNNNNNNNINNNTSNKHQVQRPNGIVTHAQPVLLNHINMKTTVNNQRVATLPNFVGTFVQTVPAQTIVTEQFVQPPQTTEIQEEKPELSLSPLPPPLYHDATKLLRVKQDVDELKGVKSQIVDDVLDILIKNGELPASAAQEPFGSVDLRELGLDVEPLEMESMDLGDNLPDGELMDVDTDWLESLIDPEPSALLTDPTSPRSHSEREHEPDAHHDALLHDPFDIDLFNIDDPDFRMSDFGWDRVDFAT